MRARLGPDETWPGHHWFWNMKYTFNECTIDTDLFQISLKGARNSLTPQTLHILEYLIANRDRVVLKDELVEQVWQGRFITDATLSTAMKEARQAVGDSGRDQHTIRTIHGKGFRFVAEIEPSVHETAPLPERDRIVLAVLPFRSLGSSPDDAFLAEGLTEDTITNLSRFRELTLLSHRTTALLAAENLSNSGMSERYAVTHVVEGSIRRSQRHLRVTVQVTEAKGGRLIATEQFDRGGGPEDLFDIQQDIAGLIAGRLGSRHGLVAQQVARSIPEGRTQSWDTYFLVAQFYEYYRSYDQTLHADIRDRLQDALKEDSGSSDGWAAFAMLLLEEYRYHINPRPDVDALALSAQAARRAVDCDARNAFARMTLALTIFYQTDIAGFRAAAEQALELNSGHCDVLAEIGSCHMFLGEYDRAVELLDRAIDLSPVHPGWYHYARCWLYASQGFTEAALVEIEKVPMPDFFWYQAHLAWLHGELGNIGRAQAAVAAMREMFPQFEDVAYEELALTGITPERGEMAVRGWRKAGLRIAERPA
ncbi:winged helix-turn-helix domain-containing protein [Ruegeria sp. 2205SS24-7]|uniref:winged helix-turn-helix domain-containing tetratricopeptide repeat protein n=1 Tax=Ruegeria discodermiae TaxID=3064389 RepID=UPI002740FBDD|nr:winged helix-turn-helix domain-containing protein [Ruegeria sp. 2205SS24-7]MDP5217354.1 winged helix-turn-helix domain-containing protein [Ruegeria sp. 2205SS24-7]